MLLSGDHAELGHCLYLLLLHLIDPLQNRSPVQMRTIYHYRTDTVYTTPLSLCKLMQAYAYMEQ